MVAMIVIKCSHYFISFNLGLIPTRISIADVEKIIGHNLNGRKSTLKPVNTERIANENNIEAIKI